MAGLQNFSKKALSTTLSKGDQIFMIYQIIREVVKRFRSNHKYLVTVICLSRQPGYHLF